tara:strand:- start:206 stop:811 length:606 start_codon:yes stop_codon:yes gene_type:complete
LGVRVKLDTVPPAVFVDMKRLCAIVCILSLAGCNREPIDFAENDHKSDRSPSETVPEVSPQKSLTPDRKEIAKPDKGISSIPKISQSNDAQPATTSNNENPPTEKLEEVKSTITEKIPSPEEEQLSPSELIARKLISNDPEDNLGVLNEALERWLNKKNTLPERVSDLVAEQFLPMLPMAPEGKVFVIDSENRRVILIVEK